MSRVNKKNKNKKEKPVSQRKQDQQKEAKARRDLLTSLGEASKHLNTLKANIHGFLKIGHDLFLTSNEWLFTEDVRVNGARQADAVDDLLILRSYMFKLQQALYKVLTTQEAVTHLTDTFIKHTTEEIYVQYISELVPIISSFGEELTAALELADNLTQKHDDIIKTVLPDEVYDSMKRIFKEAAENREAMREINLTKVPSAQPEEVPTMEMQDETPSQTTESSEIPDQTTSEEASKSQDTDNTSRLDSTQVSERERTLDGCSEGNALSDQVLETPGQTEEQDDHTPTSEPSVVKVN